MNPNYLQLRAPNIIVVRTLGHAVDHRLKFRDFKLNLTRYVQ